MESTRWGTNEDLTGDLTEAVMLQQGFEGKVRKQIASNKHGI